MLAGPGFGYLSPRIGGELYEALFWQRAPAYFALVGDTPIPARSSYVFSGRAQTYYQSQMGAECRTERRQWSTRDTQGRVESRNVATPVA